ncbi:MAG: TetR/AcrR family transcriptional regulator C-terminal ligand-binding domain-containing protein, partial [Marmoricola sp.]|nr:TetR/AcrR family transcriptional regulator C-terminal ligand-binding domain-containing protein [Marmoricola sp.]
TVKESMRDERIATLYREANDRAERGARTVFQRAVDRGEVRPDVHLDAALQFIGSLVVTRAVNGHDMPSLDELDQLVDFVLHGIAAQP